MSNIYHYFENACRRERALSIEGQPANRIVDDGGNSVVFWLAVEQDTITGAEYKCTTCMTLVGFCEHLRDLLAGMPISAAAAMSAADLLRFHPEVPGTRRDRAHLVIRAMRLALEGHTIPQGALS